MYTTMRSIAVDLADAPDFRGDLRLYISSREHEGIYAVSDQDLSKFPVSEDVLYIVDWTIFQNLIPQHLPRNILCINAQSLERPALPDGHNIILTDTAVTVDTLRALLFEDRGEREESPYAAQLLDALYSGSLDKLCETTSTLCGNPVIFLSFNYRTTAFSLLGSDNPVITQICEDGIIGHELVTYLHDKNNQPLLTSTILTVPGTDTRFLYMPITQAGVHLASILLFEDRVAISENDRQLLSHVSKCFRLLHPMLDSKVPTRLIYEYALVRLLSHNYEGQSQAGDHRFSTLGYKIKSHLYIIVLDNAVDVSAEDLRQHLNTVVDHARQIVGGEGLCTPFRDHCVVLLNMDSSAPLQRILADLRLFCASNGLRAGISPCFSDISQLRRHYRYALDAVGLGSVIWKEDLLYAFEDLRIYKFVATCIRSFPMDDLVPDYLMKLINYDHENNTELIETLYCYIYTVKNTKAAADLLHIHRNTLLYRLEKVRDIIGVDLEDGDVFLQLMLAFKFLEFQASQTERKLCFTPIVHKPDLGVLQEP